MIKYFIEKYFFLMEKKAEQAPPGVQKSDSEAAKAI